MATGTTYIYGSFPAKSLNEEINWTADTHKVLLLSSGYTPDIDSHEYQSDVSAFEVTGSGYTAGGEIMSNSTITYSTGSNQQTLDGDDVTWSGSTITAMYAALYDSTPGTSGTNPLEAYVDFGEELSSDSSIFKVEWGTSGISVISV